MSYLIGGSFVTFRRTDGCRPPHRRLQRHADARRILLLMTIDVVNNNICG
jgi:hypothetical protein